ncbi:MAG: sigma-54-dependent Fis family transcriptional regulator [Candidatus Nitrohelix vancouverensis]|uniref:Sigma-54-dependent Fis family transcriptional regulator n=1 Tax=Candidatus Nitrohelix vancouverensis TaxID=2705534 RepID=A0A7T0C279_9BACT|nr:MAG: sigma-54-dependent Fis family transcriptional regulator [Candidatus Nitrohelix vancouverensis]
MTNNNDKKILVVDDEEDMRIALETTLKRENYQTQSAKNGAEALERLESDAYDLVVTDVKMPGMSGLELLRSIKTQWPQTQVVMMTAFEIIDNAVDAMKAGAFDFLIKPFQADVLVSAVHRALKTSGVTTPSVDNPRIAGSGERAIITQNKKMQELLTFAEHIAYSKSTVLISGETGTGKELFSRFIHQRSPRASQPFLAINCAALPENLLETELFGHEKGAFTGASQRKEGKFELAHNGTLLLDEVTEMSLPLQAKLLRVLQEHEVDKVGGKRPIPVDVRVIATTNADVKSRIKKNEFREDLYYRLNVIPIKLPPLRERKEDIPTLAQHFLDSHCKEISKKIASIHPDTLALLKNYTWPGNVREFGNIIERAALMCQGETLLPGHLFFDEDEDANGSATFAESGFQGTIHEMEKALILKTLEETNGNKTQAAERLGISIRTLRNKLTEYQNS